jgi:hypothetical protein
MKGARGSRNIHTLIAIDTMQGSVHVSYYILHACQVVCCLHTSMHGATTLLFASELHVDSAVFIACTSEPVVSNICRHRILLD